MTDQPGMDPRHHVIENDDGKPMVLTPMSHIVHTPDGRAFWPSREAAESEAARLNGAA